MITRMKERQGARGGRLLVLGVAALVIASAAACSVLLDHDATQCQTDNDCSQFGGHPYCQSTASASSGLGPYELLLRDPAAAQDFLNQCSTAQCFAFDDC